MKEESREQASMTTYPHKLLNRERESSVSGNDTLAAVISFVNNVLRALDGSRSTAGVFYYSSKVCNCVNHRRLISKLKRIGVMGFAVKLLQSI